MMTIELEYSDWLKEFVMEIMDPSRRVQVEQVIVKQGLASRHISRLASRLTRRLTSRLTRRLTSK
jgi:hypothetical protein